MWVSVSNCVDCPDEVRSCAGCVNAPHDVEVCDVCKEQSPVFRFPGVGVMCEECMFNYLIDIARENYTAKELLDAIDPNGDLEITEIRDV